MEERDEDVLFFFFNLCMIVDKDGISPTPSLVVQVEGARVMGIRHGKYENPLNRARAIIDDRRKRFVLLLNMRMIMEEDGTDRVHSTINLEGEGRAIYAVVKQVLASGDGEGAASTRATTGEVRRMVDSSNSDCMELAAAGATGAFDSAGATETCATAGAIGTFDAADGPGRVRRRSCGDIPRTAGSSKETCIRRGSAAHRLGAEEEEDGAADRDGARDDDDGVREGNGVPRPARRTGSASAGPSGSGSSLRRPAHRVKSGGVGRASRAE